MRRHRRTTLEIAKADISNFLERSSKTIFTSKELEDILTENRESWRIAKTTSVGTFIQFLIGEGKLQPVEIKFPSSWTPKFLRYIWGDVSNLEIISSLRPDFYFSHYTAMFLHHLTEQVPQTIYLTWQQPEKKQNSAQVLLQSKIDWAFKRSPRISNNVAFFKDQQIYLLYGTGKAGIIKIEGPKGKDMQVTSVERTLIDITVRPFYAGGVFEVLKAFRLAKDKVSVNKLSAMLRKLGYKYPYHQAIGFYLEKSEVYKESSINIFRKMDKDYDFYLTYQMKDKDIAYSKEWRLFYPKGF